MIGHKRVQLRALSNRDSGDAENYEKWINDEETNLWRGLYHPTSSVEASQWIEQQMVTLPDRLTLSVDLKTKKGSQSIGFIGLRSICPRSRRAEIWIYIGDKSTWGDGIGGEAITALCRYAFKEMNLHRLWLELDPEHAPALRCYQKVGFVREGTLRQAYYRRGKYRDTCMMGLLRPEFEKKGTASA